MPQAGGVECLSIQILQSSIRHALQVAVLAIGPLEEGIEADSRWIKTGWMFGFLALDYTAVVEIQPQFVAEIADGPCRIVFKLRHGPMMTKSWVYGIRIGHSRGFSFIPNPYSPSMATSNCRIFLTALSHGKATRRYSGTHT